MEQKLIRHLLSHYDTDARGVINVNSTIRVEIELLLLRIQALVCVYLLIITQYSFTLISARE